jgi:hypothetical protein
MRIFFILLCIVLSAFLKVHSSCFALDNNMQNNFSIIEDTIPVKAKKHSISCEIGAGLGGLNYLGFHAIGLEIIKETKNREIHFINQFSPNYGGYSLNHSINFGYKIKNNLFEIGLGYSSVFRKMNFKPSKEERDQFFEQFPYFKGADPYYVPYEAQFHFLMGYSYKFKKLRIGVNSTLLYRYFYTDKYRLRFHLGLFLNYVIFRTK